MSVQTGPVALALDEVLTNPELVASVAELAAVLVDPSTRDQLAAAARDTDHLADALTEAGVFGPRMEFGAEEVPGWLRLPLFELWCSWVLGRASTCMHAPRVDRPQPVFSAAWRPGLIACVRCAHLLQLRPRSIADRTCDSCGRVTTGPENGDGIHPSAVLFGMVTYYFGACGDCRPWEPTHAEKEKTA